MATTISERAARIHLFETTKHLVNQLDGVIEVFLSPNGISSVGDSYLSPELVQELGSGKEEVSREADKDPIGSKVGFSSVGLPRTPPRKITRILLDVHDSVSLHPASSRVGSPMHSKDARIQVDLPLRAFTGSSEEGMLSELTKTLVGRAINSDSRV